MTATLIHPSPEKTTQRVVLSSISWQTYQSLLAEAGDNRSSRFSYFQEVLEIIMPSDLHETVNCLLKQFVTTLSDELKLKRKGFGSTTLNREDLKQGAEPDSCFYIQNVDRIRGRKINLSIDPPPDLIIEVDLTSPSTNRFSIYKNLGVPEIWRYLGETVQFFQFQNGEYVICECSATFPIVSSEIITQFLQMAETEDDMTIIDALRVWVREQLRSPENE
ncbi:MAG: Uma2 family endonuclease [Microcoleus sp. PH2017_29_MFU_D_A]|jgi:Uma2 family endonuclease|uniref:Uma2 family endonuclease n=1 Tax=unclassified Microcoleus TaxID=2642155 RepID=UPI001E09CC0E|nr:MULTISPECIES: Uma2 family endonuclease [unclassified Microcoleus]MCC3440909.1 Uma2 family endonuclease [Microcoleus sp. PH2017_03_ELD_O_A]MCC3464551.1 Uma2 family endonuclease [Microcoleus sp. PH2017_06_SFM_O_A]MCC3503052.1 Uma2 family endonuclease [Microcoleus sp. PH2017_19_SFW_U_A]MCC3513237.1 Uma2 family endonuclease [Microcoleus sp. PH2017_17_BER_D_A]TAE15503.1 MAG: Uma2 family endonuclease [Oscillatoriales cyanobacterium]